MGNNFPVPVYVVYEMNPELETNFLKYNRCAYWHWMQNALAILGYVNRRVFTPFFYKPSDHLKIPAGTADFMNVHMIGLQCGSDVIICVGSKFSFSLRFYKCLYEFANKFLAFAIVLDAPHRLISKLFETFKMFSTAKLRVHIASFRELRKYIISQEVNIYAKA